MAELVGGDAWSGFRQGFCEPLSERDRGVAGLGENFVVLMANQEVEHDLPLKVFREVAEVEVAVVSHRGERALEMLVRHRVTVGFEGGAQGADEALAEGLQADPGFGDEQTIVEAAGGDAGGGKVFGDHREVPTEERLADGGGFEETEPEALCDGGGDEMGGVPDPGGEGLRGLWRGDDVSDRVEDHGKFRVTGKGHPFVVNRAPAWVLGFKADGEAGACRSQGGEQEKLAEVLSANAASRVEHEGFARASIEGLDPSGWGDGVRIEEGVLGGKSGVDQQLSVARVDEGVNDLRRVRIERLGIGDDRIGFWASVLGEIVILEDQRFTGLRENPGGIAEVTVLADGVVVEVLS